MKSPEFTENEDVSLRVSERLEIQIRSDGPRDNLLYKDKKSGEKGKRLVRENKQEVKVLREKALNSN
jgi:hypothetical protein